MQRHSLLLVHKYTRVDLGWDTNNVAGLLGQGEKDDFLKILVRRKKGILCITKVGGHRMQKKSRQAHHANVH